MHNFFISSVVLFILSRTFSVISQASTSFQDKLVTSAQKQIGVTCHYDPAYTKLSYPGGDVPMDRGVCTDVIIRVLRDFDIDLQQSINQHMKKNWKLYPKNWGLGKPDSNIDHRRVPNMSTYFKALHFSLNPDPLKEAYLPGDVVIWDLGNGILHVGMVSNAIVPYQTRYKIIHNICCGVKEEDLLMSYKIISHFRLSEKTLKNN